MPMHLEGSCRCAAVRFALDSHAPHPYQRCYCSICRKTAGGGGYAINIMGTTASLSVRGEATRVYHASIAQPGGGCAKSRGERHFCPACASALWVFDPDWPDLVHPFASAIDTALLAPPERVHILLADKAPWVEPHIGANDACFEGYPDESIEDWHRARGLWLD